MRVACVYFSRNGSDALRDIAKGLARGIESQGHSVELVDGSRDHQARLTMYEYVAVGADPLGLLGGKISPGIEEFLSSAGMIGGKRTFAFVRKKLLGSQKALSVLMKKLEGEGMFIRFSDVLQDGAEAEEIGKRLKI